MTYSHAEFVMYHRDAWLEEAREQVKRDAEIAADTRDLPRPTQVDGATWLLVGAAG